MKPARVVSQPGTGEFGVFAVIVCADGDFFGRHRDRVTMRVFIARWRPGAHPEIVEDKDVHAAPGPAGAPRLAHRRPHHHRPRRRMRPRRAMRPRRPRPSSDVSLLEVPVGCSKSSGARRRAVASFKENIESPAYSRGGDQSAGFYGYGIQQATRLMRVLLKRCGRGYRTFRRRCQSPGGDFYRHAGLARRPAFPARGRGWFF